MKTFAIQTVDNQIIHDFSFHLIEAIKYHNWYNNEKTFEYVLTETVGTTDFIPVGSVEFVLDILLLNHNIKNIRPLNIPPQLMKVAYLKRDVKIVSTPDVTTNVGSEPIFVKDNIKIKGYCEIVPKNRTYPTGEWLISEVVDIQSEWRAFVYNDELVGLQNYLGDFTLFPDVDLMQSMIKDYKGNNLAYTLDVGVSAKGTFVIEAHDFFSCGLYGFSNYKVLPYMFIRTWDKLKTSHNSK